MDDQEFGERLRAVVKALGLTQVELAAAVGVTQSAVSNWMRGETTLDLAHAVETAKYLGLPLEYLIDGEPPTAESVALRRRHAAAVRSLGMRETVRALEEQVKMRRARRKSKAG